MEAFELRIRVQTMNGKLDGEGRKLQDGSGGVETQDGQFDGKGGTRRKTEICRVETQDGQLNGTGGDSRTEASVRLSMWRITDAVSSLAMFSLQIASSKPVLPPVPAMTRV